MADRVGFPPGVPCWVDTTQPDPPAAAAFYGSLFGWDVESEGSTFIARLGGRDVAAIGSLLDGTPASAAWNTYIGVASADAAAARVEAAGGRVLVDPIDVAAAGRMAVCADGAGAAFSVWEPGTRLGAELVNAPGTWNWSDLNTADREGAAAFYRAVFGWEAGAVSFGEHETTMWRLPGYADFLEQFDPGLRQRHAEYGAPEGFSDAIAWMLPLAAGEAPNWSVTFSVDDADAVAALAEELGGAVVVAPNDVGPVRVAVLRDPQGAQFTVSRFG